MSSCSDEKEIQSAFEQWSLEPWTSSTLRRLSLIYHVPVGWAHEGPEAQTYFSGPASGYPSFTESLYLPSSVLAAGRVWRETQTSREERGPEENHAQGRHGQQGVGAVVGTQSKGCLGKMTRKGTKG